eukprot:gnl/MRDRNA2_/MRDRNA2_300658_c0_seq1.p1 gnl/MRDRNA2_/MRDRNA2_300658_c0~~gnl/MRDRNA2_/MRDRNA2_300658_c0_seq1.p1  ORF type:complete len:247 (-),score=18.80 gnl/MRDRNA2_/MRDRNA2_300658_c0_seq1:19-660(-)
MSGAVSARAQRVGLRSLIMPGMLRNPGAPVRESAENCAFYCQSDGENSKAEGSNLLGPSLHVSSSAQIPRSQRARSPSEDSTSCADRPDTLRSNSHTDSFRTNSKDRLHSASKSTLSVTSVVSQYEPDDIPLDVQVLYVPRKTVQMSLICTSSVQRTDWPELMDRPFKPQGWADALAETHTYSTYAAATHIQMSKQCESSSTSSTSATSHANE